jgi:hypothetical protein
MKNGKSFPKLVTRRAKFYSNINTRGIYRMKWIFRYVNRQDYQNVAFHNQISNFRSIVSICGYDTKEKLAKLSYSYSPYRNLVRECQAYNPFIFAIYRSVFFAITFFKGAPVPAFYIYSEAEISRYGDIINHKFVPIYKCLKNELS